MDEYLPNNCIIMNEEDTFCENNFIETTTRHKDGRFIVNIPFKDEVTNLGDLKALATKRFYCLERKLEKNVEIKTQYNKFINEYLKLNHMEKINDSDINTSQTFYLPHHHVVRECSSTTKLRVVFDRSMKSSTGLSLNESQYSGPALQTELFAVLLIFRKYNYVATADINKMYRQILVDSKQRMMNNEE